MLYQAGYAFRPYAHSETEVIRFNPGARASSIYVLLGVLFELPGWIIVDWESSRQSRGLGEKVACKVFGVGGCEVSGVRCPVCEVTGVRSIRGAKRLA